MVDGQKKFLTTFTEKFSKLKPSEELTVKNLRTPSYFSKETPSVEQDEMRIASGIIYEINVQRT